MNISWKRIFPNEILFQSYNDISVFPPIAFSAPSSGKFLRSVWSISFHGCFYGLPPSPCWVRASSCFPVKNTHKKKQYESDFSPTNFHHIFRKLQGAPKKCPIAIFSLNLFQRPDYTFSHVFRNQNFKPVPSKHFKHTHSEYQVP